MRFETEETYRTGDINFFAACMTIGIAPSFPNPAEILQNDDGRDYFSFRLNAASECGLHDTKVINRAWNSPLEFKAESPGHPFSLVMDFSRFALGAKRKDDWIEKGAEFLGISRDAVRKALRDISGLEANAPESPLTYVVCYISNRFAAIDWAKKSVPHIVINSGKSVVMVDTRLPLSKQREIIGYL